MRKKKLVKFNLKSKKVFIVGGSGLLGNEIIKLLLENYASVKKGFDQKISKKLQFSKI